MLYECSCGFTAETATSFYRHLASSKDDGADHQLVQARFTDRPRSNKVQPQLTVGTGTAAVTAQTQDIGVSSVNHTTQDKGQAPRQIEDNSWQPDASWVDEYVDSISSRQGTGHLPGSAVTSTPASVTAAAAEILGGMPAGAPTVRPSSRPDGLSADAVQLEEVDNIDCRPALPVAPSHQQPPSSQSGPSTVARISGALVTAVVQTLKPWRLFDSQQDQPAEQQRWRDQVNPVAYSSHERLELVRSMESLFKWQEPWRSARALGLGLYVLLCVQQFTQGSAVIQPATVTLLAAFCYLIYNTARNAVQAYRQAAYQAGKPGASYVEPQSHKDKDLELHEVATGYLHAFANRTIPYAAALIVLAHQVLSGRRIIRSALVASLLWFGMCISELKILPQWAFFMLSYAALFVVPAAYAQRSHVLDAVVEDVLRFVTRLLVSCNRVSLLLTAAVVLAEVIWLPMNIILRTSLAMASGLAILVWQSHMLPSTAASTSQQPQRPTVTS